MVVAEEATKSLLAIKRVTIAKREVKLKLEFVVPEVEGGKIGGEGEEGKAGDGKVKRQLKCLLMCDSYVGVDQEMGFEVEVKPAEEGDSEDDEEDEDEDGGDEEGGERMQE